MSFLIRALSCLLLLAVPLAGCVIRVDDDPPGPFNSPPEVVDAEAWCDNALTFWTLDALVTDPDGDLDIDFVWAEVWEIYPDKSETYVDTVDLYYDVDGWWTREIESEFGYLNCEFQYTYCFDFQAEDVFGDVSDYYSYCN
ncbi:hypothetical protein L6R50_26870 [Myxococcota bacterium]|nr:hypothetical protein [Myxococcota bacterium]